MTLIWTYGQRNVHKECA